MTEANFIVYVCASSAHNCDALNKQLTWVVVILSILSVVHMERSKHLLPHHSEMLAKLSPYVTRICDMWCGSRPLSHRGDAMYVLRRSDFVTNFIATHPLFNLSDTRTSCPRNNLLSIHIHTSLVIRRKHIELRATWSVVCACALQVSNSNDLDLIQ